MNANTIVLLDYSIGEIIKIHLSQDEQLRAEEFEDFECYIRTLEPRFGFRLDDCLWMSVDVLSERTYCI